MYMFLFNAVLQLACGGDINIVRLCKFVKFAFIDLLSYYLYMDTTSKGYSKLYIFIYTYLFIYNIIYNFSILLKNWGCLMFYKNKIQIITNKWISCGQCIMESFVILYYIPRFQIYKHCILYLIWRYMYYYLHICIYIMNIHEYTHSYKTKNWWYYKILSQNKQFITLRRQNTIYFGKYT